MFADSESLASSTGRSLPNCDSRSVERTRGGRWPRRKPLTARTVHPHSAGTSQEFALALRSCLRFGHVSV